MFEKDINITQQTVGNAVWYWFALPLFAGHCHDLVERMKPTKELVMVFWRLLAAYVNLGGLAEPFGVFVVD